MYVSRCVKSLAFCEKFSMQGSWICAFSEKKVHRFHPVSRFLGPKILKTVNFMCICLIFTLEAQRVIEITRGGALSPAVWRGTHGGPGPRLTRVERASRSFVSAGVGQALLCVVSSLQPVPAPASQRPLGWGRQAVPSCPSAGAASPEQLWSSAN